MSSTITPNMSLIVPGVGSEAGPDYAQEINNDLALLDQHTHAPGMGVAINPAGININDALTFNNNLATHLAGLTLVAQSITPAVNTIYESGNDLYFVDGVGNNVRITQSGGIAGSPGSIANLTSPASASYVAGSKTFVWQSDTSIAANLDAASLLLRNITPNSTFAITLSPPASLAANVTETLPLPPVSGTKLMQMDSTGAMSAAASVDGVTIQNISNLIGIAPAGVGTTELADGSVTGAKLAASAKQTIISQVLTGSGNFTVPTGVSSLIVMGIGAGGGGGGTVGGGGGGGGTASVMGTFQVTTTPAATIAYVVGAGGAGGAASPGANGATGGDTTFGALTFRGAAGGLAPSGSTGGTSSASYAGAAGGGAGGNSGVAGSGGQGSSNFVGGSAGATASGFGGGGGGGSSQLGRAGDGGNPFTTGAGDPGGGFGAGGGGAAGAGYSGGNGSPGTIIVSWVA